MYRVKNKNKYIEKNCASRWSFTKNHYMMHGEQNLKVKRRFTLYFYPLLGAFLECYTVNFYIIVMQNLDETKNLSVCNDVSTGLTPCRRQVTFTAR
jgi:hypothetical protein